MDQPLTLIVVSTIFDEIADKKFPEKVSNGILGLLKTLCEGPDQTWSSWEQISTAQRLRTAPLCKGYQARLQAADDRQAYLLTQVLPDAEAGDKPVEMVSASGAEGLACGEPALLVSDSVCDDVAGFSGKLAERQARNVLVLQSKYHLDRTRSSLDMIPMHADRSLYKFRLDSRYRALTRPWHASGSFLLFRVEDHDDALRVPSRSGSPHPEVRGLLRWQKAAPAGRTPSVTVSGKGRTSAAMRQLDLQDSEFEKLGIGSDLRPAVRSLKGPQDLDKVKNLYSDRQQFAVRELMKGLPPKQVRLEQKKRFGSDREESTDDEQSRTGGLPQYSVRRPPADSTQRNGKAEDAMANTGKTSDTNDAQPRILKVSHLLKSVHEPAPLDLKSRQGRIHLRRLNCHELEEVARLTADCRKTDFKAAMALVRHTILACAVKPSGEALFEKEKQAGELDVELAIEIFEEAARLNGLETKRISACSDALRKIS